MTNTTDLQRMGQEFDGGWLPIETAPRDGTRILVIGPHRSEAVIVHWLAGRDHTARYNAWGNGSYDRCGTPSQYGDEWFTHWMPLPKPPAPNQQTESQHG